VLALAAAISVPEVLGNGRPTETRNLILFLAFCVILVTLVLQGLTLPALIRRLGLAGSTGMEPEEKDARRIVLSAAIHSLEEGRKGEEANVQIIYDDLIKRYRHRLRLVSDGVEEDDDGWDGQSYSRLQSIAIETLQAERRTLIGLRDRGRISDDVLRAIERELDLAQSRYQGTPVA